MRSRWTAGDNSCTVMEQNCGDTETEWSPANGCWGKRGTGKGGKPPLQRESVMRTELKVGKSRKGPSRKAAIVFMIPVP